MGNSFSTTRTTLADKPVVVVIGGGFAGTQIARGLDRHLNVILIDQKNYHLFDVGSLRPSVDASLAHTVIAPYTHLLEHGHVICAEVAEVLPAGVRLIDFPDLIRYDFLVIASGSNHSFPRQQPLRRPNDYPALFKESEKAIAEVG